MDALVASVVLNSANVSVLRREAAAAAQSPNGRSPRAIAEMLERFEVHEQSKKQKMEAAREAAVAGLGRPAFSRLSAILAPRLPSSERLARLATPRSPRRTVSPASARSAGRDAAGFPTVPEEDGAEEVAVPEGGWTMVFGRAMRPSPDRTQSTQARRASSSRSGPARTSSLAERTQAALSARQASLAARRAEAEKAALRQLQERPTLTRNTQKLAERIPRAERQARLLRPKHTMSHEPESSSKQWQRGQRPISSSRTPRGE